MSSISSMSKPSGDAINVVGIVVHTAPGRKDAVRMALVALPGVDVHAETADGRLVATAIDTGEAMAIDQLAAMNRTPGVVSAMLAYHQIEHPEATPAAAPCCGAASHSDQSCSSKQRA